MQRVSKELARKLIGKTVYAVRKDGSVASGKLVKIQQNKLYLRPTGSDKGKVVRTKAILPLVLFDLLAIGTLPYAYGTFGGGFGGGYGGGYGNKCCPQPCGGYNNIGYNAGYDGYNNGYNKNFY